jgi:hypothetical protein
MIAGTLERWYFKMLNELDELPEKIFEMECSQV